jgi:hypothetical protein
MIDVRISGLGYSRMPIQAVYQRQIGLGQGIGLRAKMKESGDEARGQWGGRQGGRREQD